MRRRYCGFAETVLVTVALVFSVWLGNSAEALAGCVGTSCEVYANQDTFVGSDDKAANYCSEATIMAGASSQYSYVTLLKFDNPLSGVPNGAKVKNVLLTLWFQVGGVSPGTCTTLYVWKGAFGWSECSVKWNTMGNTGAEIGSSGSICDSKSYAEVSLSLSESDIASIASNGILVGAKQMGTGYASFKTKNAGKPARIEFDYEPVGPCPGECTPGQTQSQACGNCGTKTRTCSNSCSWGSWGSCNGQGSCSPGQSQNQACGSCGTQTKTCSNSCSWGSWGSCNGQGVCSPGQTTSCSGQCGSGTKTCSGSCQWGSCSAPDVGECTPGQNQSQACGNCGTQTRTCSNSCSWGSWGSCNGQGSCSPGQSQSQACGSCGTQTRTCSNSCSWGSWGSCTGEGVCSPGQTTSCSGQCGSGTKTCTGSCQWGSCSAPDVGECTPGQTQSQGCGNCGTQARTCSNSCSWGSWGSCNNQGVCSPGLSQNQGCGNCGTQTKTCSNSCSWGSWGSCNGQGSCTPGQSGSSQSCGNCGTKKQTCNNSCQYEWGSCTGEGSCTPGQSQSQACGNGGTQTKTCSNSCQWSSWGSCIGEDDCIPGQTQSQACGNCGKQTKTCSNSGFWGSWGSCNVQGDCSPGQSQSQACGICGTKTRTCSNSCSWGGWGACNDPCEECTPSCGGKQCGDDGCGGSCGNCPANETCQAGQCVSQAGCGDITYEGCCDGPVLTWCENEELTTIDCTDNPNCGWQAEAGFYDCGTGGAADPSGANPKDCNGGCTSNCAGSNCGDDGCGGSCGECGNNEQCDDGVCTPVCQPACAGKQCGPDGCGGSCGNCPANETCQAGQCVSQAGCGDITYEGCCDGPVLTWCENEELTTIDCTDNPNCGWQAEAGFYDCGTGGAADPSGANPKDCNGGCTSNCAGSNCGDDGCGGSCGECGNNEQCDDGVCTPVCQPACAGKECGPDGCGGSCGNCEGGECVEGLCELEPECGNGTVEEGEVCEVDTDCDDYFVCAICTCVPDICEPACAGKECGDDGCGGNCGPCPAAAPICEANVCVPPPVEETPPVDNGDGGVGGGGCGMAYPNATSGLALLLAFLGLVAFLRRRFGTTQDS